MKNVQERFETLKSMNTIIKSMTLMALMMMN